MIKEYKNRITSLSVYDAVVCEHSIIFRESIPANSKWHCRQCFEEIKDLERYQ